MNHCVLVKICRNEISFWYQIQGSPYFPLEMNEGNKIPLYFFVNGSDFIIGNFARERANLNDPNSYYDYFDIIKDPSKYFTIHGDSKPVKQLIYYGIENYLSHFVKTVLYKNDSIESYRQDFCLRFWFDLNIEDKEKILIEGLFKDAGYDNAHRINYFSALFESLSFNKLLISETPLLLLTGIDNVLYLQTFKFPSPECHYLEHFEGQGSDPRVKILADIIIDDIQQSKSYLHLEKEKEVAHILPTVVKLLQNPKPIMSGEVPLISGDMEYFKVRLRDLEERLIYYTGFEKIYLSIDDIILKNGLSIDKLNILLFGQEINTNYFLEKLLKKYPKVKGIEDFIAFDSIKFIFKQISANNYTPVSSSNSSNISLHQTSAPTTNSSVPPIKTIAPPISTARPVAAPPPRAVPPPVAAPPPRAVPPPPTRTAPPPVAVPPPRAVPPPPTRTAPPPVAVPPPRAVPPPPTRTAPPPVATPPPRASVPPHIVAPSVKATPPPPPPPPPKASTPSGSPDLEVVDNNSMVILRYKVKSLGGEELKSTKLKKTDFGKIVELVKSGSKLSAVNSLKEKTGLSLKSAKDIIDSIKIK